MKIKLLTDRLASHRFLKPGITRSFIVPLMLLLMQFSFAQTTVTYNMSSLGVANGAVTGTGNYTVVPNIITVSFAQNSSGTAPTYFTTGGVRLYQNATKGGSIKISVATGYKITGVTVTKASGDGDGPAGYLVDGGSEAGTFADGTTINVIPTSGTMNATSYVEYYNKGNSSTTRCYITAISVTYAATGPSITLGNSNVLSGALTSTYGTASATARTVTVSGSSLTANIIATAANHFEVSNNGTTWGQTATFTQSGGAVSGTLSVRLAASAPVNGSYNNVTAATLTSSAATDALAKTATTGNSVSKKALTLTVNPRTITYGETVANVIAAANNSYVLSGFVNGETSAAGLTGTPTYTTTYAGNENAGVVGETVSYNNGLSATNYTFSNVSGTLTIQRANTTSVTVTNGSPYTYIPGTPQGPTAVNVVPSASNGAVSYLYSGTENSGNIYSASATRPTNAGSYSVVATVAQSTNYESQSSPSTPFTINRAASTITVTGANSYAYNGSEHGPTTYDHTGSSGAVTFRYTGVGSTSYPESATRPTAVGTYKAVAILAADNNYASAVSDDFNFQITSVAVPQITSSLTWSMTYGVAATAYTVTASNNPTSFNVSGLPAGLSYSSTTHEITGVPTVAPGNYEVTLSATNEGGTGDEATLVITVSQKVVTISDPLVADKVYDGNATAVLTGTANGFVNGDDVALALSGNFSDANAGQDKPVTSTSTITGAKASYYILTQPTGLTANISKATPTVVVTGSNAFTFNGLAQGPATSTVTPVAAGTAAYSYTGTENGGAAYDPSSTRPTNAGSYSIVATVAESTNYTSASSPAFAFTIAKGNQTITGLPATRTEVYGVLPYTLSAVSTSGLNVAYTSSNTAVATVDGSTITVKTVGTTVITARQEGDANWNAATEVTQELTVSTKDLTISGLAPVNKVYDQTTTVEVGGTPQYVGLANGESFAVTGTVTWAFADKNAGAAKPLVRTGIYNAPSANYTIIQPALTADITKKDIALTSINAVTKVYNASPVAEFANVASTQVLSGDQVTFEVLGTFSDANAGLNKAVTVSAVNTAGTDGGNYLVPVFPTGLTADITKANQTITVSNLPTTINIGTPINLSSFALSTGGLPLTYTSSIPAIASISGTELSGNNPGTTTITFSQPGNSNYNAAASVERNIDVLDVPVAIAQWDFYNLSSNTTATTVTAKNRDAKLSTSSAILTRGPLAVYSSGTSSFRTTGFKNDGISVANQDYFQTSFTADADVVSITSIQGRVIGTNTFTEAPGVQVQFAYSLDGSNYNLINSSVAVVGNTTIPSINTAAISDLQNLLPGKTVYFRFYASGQTTTGGYGFSSPNAGDYGLEFFGKFKPSQITWSGNDWSNVNGPVASQNVVIDGPYNRTAGFEANNVTITEDGLLTIKFQQDVTVNGSITLPSDNKILIENDGNLIQTAAGADTNPTNYEITAKRVSNLPKQGYTYWSSPLSGQNLYSFSEGYNPANGGTGTGTPWNRFYVYNEANDYFVTSIPNEITLSSTSTFETGRGYAIRGMERFGDVFTDNEFSFNGKINNGQLFSPALKNSCNVENACDKGYNLIGNPYPSSLDFDALYAANSDRMYATAYFWTNSDVEVLQQSGSNYEGNNYAVYNLSGGTQPVEVDPYAGDTAAAPNGIVKLGQGFIIKAKVAGKGQKVEFNNSMRVGYSADAEFYSKKKSEDRNRFWLTMTSPDHIANTILLAYTPEATNDFEMNYDGEYLVIGSDAFYSTLDSRKLAIQGRAAFTDTDQVALGNIYSKDGVYKISIRDKEGIFNAGQIIYLKDKLLNKTVNLSQEDYSFTATKGTDETRFEVVYRQAVLGTDNVTKSDFQVYRDGTAYVVSSSKKLGRVEIYDTAGRLMKTLTANDTNVRIDTSAFVNGVYIIKAENSGDVKTKKIIK